MRGIKTEMGRSENILTGVETAVAANGADLSFTLLVRVVAREREPKGRVKPRQEPQFALGRIPNIGSLNRYGQPNSAMTSLFPWTFFGSVQRRPHPAMSRTTSRAFAGRDAVCEHHLH